MSDASILCVAGAAAGAVEAVVVHPFDTIKTRHQLNVGANSGIAASFLALVREGGVPRLYRGLLPELAGMLVKSSAMYAAYDSSHGLLSSAGPALHPAAVAFAAGLVSGVPEAVIVTPFQVVKVRLQAREHLGRYRGPMDCLAQTVRGPGGPAELWRGLGPTLWRNCVWNAVYFATLHTLRTAWTPPAADRRAAERPGPGDGVPASAAGGGGGGGDGARTVAAGFVAGMLATVFNSPFDVVKSRSQSALPPGDALGAGAGAGAGGRPAPSTLGALWRLARAEGVAACYKGFRAKAIRMGLAGAVGMPAYETSLSLLRAWAPAGAAPAAPAGAW